MPLYSTGIGGRRRRLRQQAVPACDPITVNHYHHWRQQRRFCNSGRNTHPKNAAAQLLQVVPTTSTKAPSMLKFTDVGALAHAAADAVKPRVAVPAKQGRKDNAPS